MDKGGVGETGNSVYVLPPETFPIYWMIFSRLFIEFAEF